MAEIRIGAPVLEKPSWGPGTGDYPLDLDSSQRFTRPLGPASPMPYPSMIGGVEATFPLYDIWLYTRGIAPHGETFLQGGSTFELGNTGIGIGGNPANLTTLRG